MDELLFKKFKQGVKQKNYSFVRSKPIGTGGFGQVFVVSKARRRYTLKVVIETGGKYINVDEQKTSNYQDFDTEIKYIKELNKCQEEYKDTLGIQIVPDYKDHFKFHKTIVHEAYGEKIEQVYGFMCIVMELFDGSVKQLMLRKDIIKDISKDKIFDNLKILRLSLEIINNKCNVCFNDITPVNLLYKYNSKQKLLIIVFADTGMTSKYTEECKDENNFEDVLKYLKTI